LKYGYFIKNSLHYIPTVLPLIKETGGILITLNKKTEKHISAHDRINFEIQYYKNRKEITKCFGNLSIDILIHPSFTYHYFKSFKNIKHVQMFHGISDKPFSYHKSLKHYSLITVPGPQKKESIMEKGLALPERIVEIGFPKIDYFLHSKFDSVAFKKKLGIDPARKTILYSPTWVDPNKYSSFSKYVVPIIKKFRDFNLLIKPHMNILRYRPWQIAKAYIMKGRNCRIYPKSINILPFMAISDVLITDISSVAQEYLAFDKPVIFLSPKPVEKIPGEHIRIWSCGDVVENKRDLFQILWDNLDNPSKYKKFRDKALQKIFLGFDGKSALRFAQALDKIQ
jgi:CDP-glycerol glycerophosphotransferase (TagB/SpsB family)